MEDMGNKKGRLQGGQEGGRRRGRLCRGGTEEENRRERGGRKRCQGFWGRGWVVKGREEEGKRKWLKDEK